MGLKLLCIVAHPDDECFAFGGALALAAQAGHETSVVCLTDGQAASNRGSASDGAELGKMRREEFAASCAVLGVTHHELMDYSDGQLEHVVFAEAAGRLVARIRAFQPDVVVTFAPDGAANTHPDHTMVSLLTAAAYHWAASAKRYPQAGPVHHAERLFLLATGFFLPERPAPMPPPWTATLDVRQVMEQRHDAFRQHKSQAPLMEKTEALFKQFGETEHYILIAQREPGPATQMTDLFAGLKGWL